MDRTESTIARQCELVGVPRATFYYQPCSTSPLNLELMRVSDEQYTKTPFYGSRRMVEILRAMGHDINRKRVQRLMREMSLEALYPKPNLSKPDRQHRVFPYLLHGVVIDHINHV